MPKTGAYGVSKLAFTQWLAHIQQDIVDGSVRIHSFHSGAVLTDAVSAFGMSEEGMSWGAHVQLPGQFAVWLANKEAAFLKGRVPWANVKELVERKRKSESDPELWKVGSKGKLLAWKGDLGEIERYS